MKNIAYLRNMHDSALLITTGGIIDEVSDAFAEMTKYDVKDLLDKDIGELFKTLRIRPDIDFEHFDKEVEYLLFTKCLEARFVNIHMTEDGGRKSFIFTERPSSRIEEKFPYLDHDSKDNKSGSAVYSASDFVLIKANQAYLSFLDKPFNIKENSLGRKIEEIIKGYRGSQIEKMWVNLLNNGEPSFEKEIPYYTWDGRAAYRDSAVLPIYEDGRIRCFVENTVDVTDRAAKHIEIEERKKLLEKQAEWMHMITDNMNDGLFIINKDGSYDYLNKRANEMLYKSEDIKRHGDSMNHTRYFYEDGQLLSFDKMPGSRVLRGETIENAVVKAERPDKVMYFNYNGSPIWDINGEVVNAVLCVRDISEKYKYDMEIRQRNKQLATIFNNISDGIFIFDKYGKYLMMNEEANKLNFPVGAWKALGDSYTTTTYYYEDGRVIPFGETPAYRALKGETIKGERVIARQLHREGVYEFNCSPVYDDNGALDMVIACTHEVTQMVENEKIIKQQRDELEAILENMSDGLSIFDKRGRYILFNKAAREMSFPEYRYMEYSEDGYSKAEYFDEEDNKISFDKLPFNRVKSGEKFSGTRMKIKLPDKTLHINVSGTPIYDSNNNFILGVLCSRDISSAIEYEEKLRKQKEQLEAIVDNMQESVFVFDKDFNVVIANKIAKKNLQAAMGRETDSFKTARFFDIEGNELPPEEAPSFLIKSRKSVKNKIVYSKKNGQFNYSIVNMTPVFDKFGDFLYGITCATDITDFMKNQQLLKETQEQLLKAEREKNEALEKAMDMKDEFLSLISHELRTPLNVINTAIQTMEFVCREELSDKANQYIRMIRQNMYRQLRLVNNLLDITRVDAGRIKIHRKNIDIVFLARSITESVYAYASQKGISLIFKSPISKRIIGIDDEKFERILLNLLSNAIKFTPKGKSIGVEVSSLGGCICIEVADTGIGIPEDKIDLVFQRFGQVDSSLSRQAEGAGIGLSLVKRFVEALQGTISVKSQVGLGSIFTILLPDETAFEDKDEKPSADLMDNRLVQITTVEFSDIYF